MRYESKRDQIATLAAQIGLSIASWTVISVACRELVTAGQVAAEFRGK